MNPDVPHIENCNAALVQDNEALKLAIQRTIQHAEAYKLEILPSTESSKDLNKSYESMKKEFQAVLFDELLEKCKRFPHILRGRQICSSSDYTVENSSLERSDATAAVRRTDGKQFMVITLKKLKIRTIHQLQRLDNEMKIMERLKHPGILELLNVWETPSCFNTVYERFGKDLFHLTGLYKDGMPAYLIHQIVEPLIDVLDHIHGQKFSHGDIKPENILIDMDGENCTLKLKDFGLASEIDDRNPLPKGPCGSAGFAAPEMFLETNFNPMKSDIWSLGCVINNLLNGHEVFDDMWMSIYSRLANRKEAAIVCAQDASEDLKMAVEHTCLMIKRSSHFLEFLPFHDLLEATLELSPRLRASAAELLPVNRAETMSRRNVPIVKQTQPHRPRIGECTCYTDDGDYEIDLDRNSLDIFDHDIKSMKSFRAIEHSLNSASTHPVSRISPLRRRIDFEY